jgi:hypothetical protein
MRLDNTMVEKPRSLIENLGVIFLRMVAIFLIAFALTYWARLTGMLPDDPVRFDTMPEHWQVAALVMAVILPVAAVGLWGLFPWGVFIWFVAIAIETAMYGWRSDLYGSNDKILFFHALTVLLYCSFKVLQFIRSRRTRERV